MKTEPYAEIMANQGFFTRMAPYRWTFEPALGAVVALAWGSTALTGDDPSSVLTVVMLAVTVGLSRLVPTAALVVAAVVNIAASGSYVDDSAALALLFVSGCLLTWTACLVGRPSVRFVALGGALSVGALLTGLLVLSLSGTHPNRLVDLGLAVLGGFLLTVVLVAGWAGSMVLRGRAHRGQAQGHRSAVPGAEATAELTAETWLMLPPTVAWLAAPVGLASRPGFRPLSRRTLLIDLGIAGCFLLLSLGIFSYDGAVSLFVVVGLSAAVAVRRLAPALALAAFWASALTQLFAGVPVQTGVVAILVVLYATAAYGDRGVRWAGLVSAGVGALLAVGYSNVVLRGVTTVSEAVALGSWDLVVTFIACFAVLGLFWTLGLLARTWQTARASRLSQHRAALEQKVAQRSVVLEQERTRIARDMHDVVAHSLAVVIAQADGARYARAENPEAADAALTTISTTAREALGDVRILLTRLRQDDSSGPQPVLADLDRMVEQMRSTGLDIEWTTTGSATTLGTGAQLAVYRIVQEALTNALRHGDTDQAVRLTLAWTNGWIGVTIDNAIRPTGVADQPGEIGHGLPGMRERALLAGGSLTAAALDGRFLVAARLPASTAAALVVPALTAAAVTGAQA